MLFNFIIGFVIPWILGFYLYQKNPKVIILIAPISSVIAFTINDWGFNYNFWDFTPIRHEQSFAALSFNLGVFPILFCSYIYYIEKKQRNNMISLLGFALLTTFIELSFVLVDKVIYGNGWNIYWTFISYFVAYLLAYGYYLLLRKHKII